MKKVFEYYKYLKESKKYIYLMGFLFFFTILIGFFFPVFFPEIMNFLVDAYYDQDSGNSFFGVFSNIFLTNIKIDFFTLLLGITIVVPLFIVLFNGYFFGFLLQKEEIPLYYLLYVMPHGIFELASFFISLGLGLKIGFIIITNRHISRFIPLIKKHIPMIAIIFIFLCIPLSFIASIIETIGLLYF